MSSLPSITRTNFWSIGLAAVLLLGLLPKLSSAQSDNSLSAVELRNWPSAEERKNLDYEVLPYMEWMRLSYRSGIEEGKPVLQLTLDWQPEEESIYEGRRVRTQDIPGSVRLVAIDLRADAYVAGEKRAELIVLVDSMISGPQPDAVDIALPGLAWEAVFEDTPAEEARWIFEQGFELRNLEIASAAFAVISDEQIADDVERSRTPRTRRHETDGPAPTSVTVYRGARAMDVIFDIFWLMGPRPYVWTNSGGERRTAIGRGRDESRSRSGRRSSGRSSDDGAETAESGDSSERSVDERDRKRKASGIRIPESSGKDDDDDDDPSRLVPYAIAAVAAAGVLAAAGGTLGYYGSSRHAPFGLTSGLVRGGGGLLLQVGVNEALLFNEPQPKKLMVKLLSFGDFFRSNIEPALGGGVLAVSEGSTITYEPSISLGAVGRYKMFLLYGGYDFWQQGAEFGAAFNFRELFRRTGESPRP